MAFLSWVQSMDGRAFYCINHSWQNPLFDVVMPLFTHLGAGGLVWLFIAFALAVFGRGKGRKMAFLAMLALVLSWFFSVEVLQNLIGRPRPFLSLPDVRILADKPAQFSFPSGHTSTSFAPATVLFRKSRRLGAAALVLAAMIGLSRIYVGVHYPLDVAGGVLVGGITGWLVLRYEHLWDRIVMRWKKMSPPEE